MYGMQTVLFACLLAIVQLQSTPLQASAASRAAVRVSDPIIRLQSTQLQAAAAPAGVKTVGLAFKNGKRSLSKKSFRQILV